MVARVHATVVVNRVMEMPDGTHDQQEVPWEDEACYNHMHRVQKIVRGGYM